jgi:hypothetical protein
VCGGSVRFYEALRSNDVNLVSVARVPFHRSGLRCTRQISELPVRLRRSGHLCLTGPYRVPNVRLTSTALLTNKTPSGTYRAPGRYEGSFFCERLIELTARDLGIDSAEMRRRNLIGAGEMPYPLPRLEPVSPAGNTECDSGDYRETLERCLAEFGWKDKIALQGREIDGRYHGVAVACFIEGGGAGPKETARLDLEADVTVTVNVGSTAVRSASPLSRQTVFDNLILLPVNPEYYTWLLSLPLLERERLLAGNWKIRPTAGLYFKREWCGVVDEVPTDLQVVRYWDLAATEKTEFNDPDWTVGIKLGRQERRLLAVGHDAHTGQPTRCRALAAQYRRAGRQPGPHGLRTGSGTGRQKPGTSPGACPQRLHRQGSPGERRQADALRTVQFAVPRRQCQDPARGLERRAVPGP